LHNDEAARVDSRRSGHRGHFFRKAGRLVSKRHLPRAGQGRRPAVQRPGGRRGLLRRRTLAGLSPKIKQSTSKCPDFELVVSAAGSGSSAHGQRECPAVRHAGQRLLHGGRRPPHRLAARQSLRRHGRKTHVALQNRFGKKLNQGRKFQTGN